MSGPLAGRRVLVTRTRERANGIVDALHRLGAGVVVVPLIAIEPVAAPDAIEAAAGALLGGAEPRWVAFTSATAVRIVLGVVGPGRLRQALVGAVGPETAAALNALGLPPDVVAGEQDAAGLARAMAARGVRGGQVWFPAAEGARDALPDGLRAAGAAVEVQAIYRSVMPADAPRRLAAALRDGVDAVTLTSGSTARHLVAALQGRRLDPGTVVACIGPQTAREAEAAGLDVGVVAAEHTGSGLAAALARLWDTAGTVG